MLHRKTGQKTKAADKTEGKRRAREHFQRREERNEPLPNIIPSDES